jgi:DNA polymerase-1
MALDLLIVDGHNLAYRCYHALAPMTNSRGQATHAILGFIKSLRSVERRWNPKCIAVVFDAGLSPERLSLCPEYKAQRPPMPPDLRSQIVLIEQYLRLARIASFRVAGVEADDLIAALARKTSRERGEVIVYSSDKDLCQLIDAQVRVVNPAHPEQALDRDAATEKFGVHPEQLGDWLALTGDASDNISGVPGIGPVTASRLIHQFGSLAAMRSTLEDVQPERIRSLLEKHWSIVERNRTMIGLKFDTEIPPWPEGNGTGASETERIAFLSDLELKSLLPPFRQPDLFDR